MGTHDAVTAEELRFVAPDDPLVAGELDLRFRVLRDPLGLGPDTVRFGFEHESLHLLAIARGEVVGCVLFHPESPTAGKLYQMAVAPERQGRGLGARLVRTLEARLIDEGIARVVLHARATAIGFYLALGYQAVGPMFDEVGIAHRRMEKGLGA
jgi:ribosomal protein S18 acetylase RimI-like enzyme